MPQLPASADTKKIQRLINVVAAVAAIMILARTALLDVPQVFPGGAKIGAVAYDLSLAYLGAWIFNYLVIVLPRRSDRRVIYRRCDPLIAQYATNVQAMIVGPMFEKASETPAPQRPDAAALHRVCGKINPNGDAPMVIGGGPGSWIHVNWLSLLKHEIDRVDTQRRSLEPFFPYFEAEAISLITSISEHYFRGYMRAMPDSIINTDFLWLEDDLLAYWEVCARLEEYRVENIQPYT